MTTPLTKRCDYRISSMSHCFSLLFALSLSACSGSTSPVTDSTPAVMEDPVFAFTPVVRVGEDVTVAAGDTITVSAAVLLQGLPTDLPVLQWESLSGPGNATFTSPQLHDTELSFDTAGVYVVKMTASNGAYSAFDTLVVNVTPVVLVETPVINTSPVVDAGKDVALNLDQTLAVTGQATDDGYPESSLVTSWDQVSGPGIATFGETSALETTVTFDQAGVYIIELTADDGELSTSDRLRATVTDVTDSTPVTTGSGTANANNNWKNVSTSDGSKPTARHEAGGVSFQNKFYLLGGRGLRDVERYDPATNKWVTLAKAPGVLNHFQPVVYQNRIYVIGALSCCYPDERVVSRIQIFDPSTNVWSEGASLPANRRRGSSGVVVYKNRIYVLAGSTNGHNGGMVNWFDEYDPATNSWKTLPDAPTARDHFGAVVINGKLVAAGGRMTDQPDSFDRLVGKVDVYNFNSGKWENGAPNIPTKRAGAVVVAYGEEVIVVGGETEQAGPAQNIVEAYNVSTQKWRKLDSMNKSRHSGGVALIGDTLHVATGSTNRGGGGETSSHEKLELK